MDLCKSKKKMRRTNSSLLAHFYFFQEAHQTSPVHHDPSLSVRQLIELARVSYLGDAIATAIP
jgi:hypothetical protein